MLIYQDYVGTIEYNYEDKCLSGRIRGIDDIITFEGESVKELHMAFEKAVEDYLAHCLATGKEPQKPSFEWVYLLSQNRLFIDAFVEKIVYNDLRRWGTQGLYPNIPLTKIDDVVDRKSIIQELELKILLYKELWILSKDDVAQNSGQLESDMQKKIQSNNAYIAALKQYLKKYKEKSFPSLPNERAWVRDFENRKWREIFGATRPDDYPIGDMLESLLRFHKKGIFTAPQSLLVYLKQLANRQGFVEGSVSSVSNQDVHSKRKTSYLKIIYALLEQANIPVKKGKGYNIQGVTRVLETQEADLDSKVIRDILREVEQEFG